MEECVENKVTNKTDKIQRNEDNQDKAKLRTYSLQMLHNATLITEMAIEMKEKCDNNEKFICFLRNFVHRALKSVNIIKNSNKLFLNSCQKVLLSTLQMFECFSNQDQKLCSIKNEYEKLLEIIEKELCENDDSESFNIKTKQSPTATEVTIKTISDKIKHLEEKQKLSDSLDTTSSKSFKSDIDEKYPDKWVRESFMDLDNVISLPPVPEDAFTCFAKTKRTSSVSSFKNLRKMKMYFHRAESTSDEDEESETEEQNLQRTDCCENDEQDSVKSATSITRNSLYLDEIKEEETFPE